jgi:neutral ceramidase
MNWIQILRHALLIVMFAVAERSFGQEWTQVGMAKFDITPSHPVVLAGYGGRTDEFEGVDQHLWARAMAIGEQNPVLVISVDNCGVPGAVVEEVADRLLERAGIVRERLVVCSTHTHNAPSLRGYARILWAERLTDDQQLRVDQYTRWLRDQLAGLGMRALDARQPAKLTWVQGKLEFGGNRRVLSGGQWQGFGFQLDGPVDHSFPILVASSKQGETIGIWANYACHCTTAGSGNRIGGDWAGFANEFIERDNPGAISLVTIGCGADVGPQPSGSIELARQHGEALAQEVQRLLAAPRIPLPNEIDTSFRRIELPFADPPSLEYFQKTATLQNFDGVHARSMLSIHKEQGKLPQQIDYPISSWRFGTELCMVFLGGEVCVDYAVRLKTELDWKRTWIHGWSHDVPCYIPSRRVLAEGGYEADFSQIYYGHPTRFAPEVEDLIVGEVKQQAGTEFHASSDQKQPRLFRVPGARERFEKRIVGWLAELRPEIREKYDSILAFAPQSTSGFSRLISNDGGEDRWFNYSGFQENRPYIRQQTKGQKLVWETAPVKVPDDGSPAVLIFIGGVGYESEPQTEGFQLSMDGRSPLNFDIARQPIRWSSARKDLELHYFPTWTSDLDSAGVFYLVVPSRDLVRGQPLEITVKSLGEGSRRWFSLDPIKDAKGIEAEVVRGLRQLKGNPPVLNDDSSDLR